MSAVNTTAMGPPVCPPSTPMSCVNGTSTGNDCCVQNPGYILQAQFWWIDPSIGPNDSFTIHGLWYAKPSYLQRTSTRVAIRVSNETIAYRFDECDGSTTADCGDTAALNHVSDILNDQGRQDLIDTMNIYWPDTETSDTEVKNNVMWSHEWSKHGSCANTIVPGCYGDAYTENVQIGDWAQTVVNLFQERNTYKALSDAGIVPGSTYSIESIQNALRPIHGGMTPAVACQNTSQLTEIYYYYYLTGNVINGKYTPADASKFFCFSLFC